MSGNKISIEEKIDFEDIPYILEAHLIPEGSRIGLTLENEGYDIKNNHIEFFIYTRQI